MLKLHVKVATLVFAKLDVFLDVALAVHPGLEIKVFVRELDFNLVGLRELVGQVALGFVL